MVWPSFNRMYTWAEDISSTWNLNFFLNFEFLRRGKEERGQKRKGTKPNVLWPPIFNQFLIFKLVPPHVDHCSISALKIKDHGGSAVSLGCKVRVENSEKKEVEFDLTNYISKKGYIMLGFRLTSPTPKRGGVEFFCCCCWLSIFH